MFFFFLFTNLVVSTFMLMAVIRISKTWNVSNLDAVDKCVEIA